MCAIIDTCVFTQVFPADGKPAKRFLPLLGWIGKKNGKMVVGGTTYVEEIKGRHRLAVFAEYERMNRLVILSAAQVDKKEKELKAKEPAKRFDDAHLVAMVVISGCRVICTDEKKAMKYFERRDFYPKGRKPPRIYRNQSHSDLCCSDNVVKKCRDGNEKKSAKKRK